MKINKIKFIFIIQIIFTIDKSICKVIKLLNYTTPVPIYNDKSTNPYSPAEEKLLKYLFKNYNPHIMPRENLNESFKLYIGLAMSQLINVV